MNYSHDQHHGRTMSSSSSSFGYVLETIAESEDEFGSGGEVERTSYIRSNSNKLTESTNTKKSCSSSMEPETDAKERVLSRSRRRSILKKALHYFQLQMGAARTIQNSFRPKLEERHKRRMAGLKIIQALRERVQQQKAARVIQLMYRSKASDLCDFVFAASVASGMDLEEALSRAQEDIEDMGSIDDMHDMEVMEELSSTLEEKAARKIQSVLRAKIQRGKAIDDLCGAMLEGASEAGLSFDDILSHRSNSEVINDILSHRSDRSGDTASCAGDVMSDILSMMEDGADEAYEALEKDQINETEEHSRHQQQQMPDMDYLRKLRERRAASRIVQSLQLYRQRIHAASVIQRHLRDNTHFRRKVAERRIVRQIEYLLDRRRRWRRTIKKACGG